MSLARQNSQCERWEWEDELMTKRKRKLTPADKAQKKRLREMYETVFLNGKMKRIRREPTVEGLPVDEFIRRNADPIWLHQNEMWELIEPEEEQEIPNTASHPIAATRGEG